MDGRAGEDAQQGVAAPEVRADGDGQGGEGQGAQGPGDGGVTRTATTA
jgi:hypothetical protein